MKKLILLLLFCISFTITKSQSWVQVPGYQISYNDILGVTRYQGDMWVLTRIGIYKVTGSTWELTSSGISVNGSIGCMYTDGIELYAGGLFSIGSDYLVILKWSSTQWLPFAYTEVTGGNPVVTILKKSGKIYAGGFFQRIGTQSVMNSFSYWAVFDGTDWTQPFSIAATGCSYGVENIEAIGDSIYVAGGFYEIGGIWTPGTFRFKEGGGMSTLDDYGFCFTARDYEVYQGSLYVGGTRRAENNLVDLGLSKRVGNTWVSNIYEIQITRTKIATLLGTMYIAGRATGAPLNGFVPIVVSYNGTTVVNEGVGISTPPNPFSYIPEATGIFADTIANKLYIYGNFTVAKGDVADNFAVKTFSIVPVHLTYFTASLNNDKTVLLKWRDETPEDGNKVEVEVSNDGRNFRSVGQITEQGSRKDYSFVVSAGRSCGQLFFRLKFEEVNITKYSDIRTVVLPCDVSIIVAGQTLQIRTTHPGTLLMRNLLGQIVRRTVLPTGPSQITLAVPAGMYIAMFTDKNGNISTQKVLIE